MHSSFVYSRLGERTGLADHLSVLSRMLAKLATNLRAYGRSEQLVHLTLQLFQVWGGGAVAVWAGGRRGRGLPCFWPS